MVETTTIGPYRILEPLGRGGMGIVYRARHVSSERAIALKTVQVPAPRWLDSIRREILALTRIRHPGVVRIVDHGVEHGRPWYAMDLVEGESLRRFGQRVWSPYRRPVLPIPPTEGVSATEPVSGLWVQSDEESADSSPAPERRSEGQIPAAAGELSLVLGMMRRICATLAFLHGEGFINGDLKPENVLLVGDQPIIIDFGLTAHHPGGSGREELEAQRGMAGTLPYMSPEQVRGEFLDARSDLYSVGCMLYELLTGSPPFVGAPRTVMQQHLTASPRQPSDLVTGVSPDLNRLTLRLLEKDVNDRYGYADEVAAELAEIANDARRLSEFPPPRSYLYRPRFVGRDALLSDLAKLRERAASGSGAMVLVAGESGVGKTRLAMELTRFVPSTRMRVVTSEASALAAESAAAVGPAPLYALRSFLRAVADSCQEGGPDVTARLLGHRRSMLAMYEPLLAHVPADESPASDLPLAGDAARHRLFRYLAETLAAFVEDQPLLWVLDDLGWADELSLAFLRSLTAEYLETHPLLILGAYRSEEPSEAIAALAELPHVTHVALPRLDDGAVRSMIHDMLALRRSLDGFTDFVARQAEGNPFFVAEYLRTAVGERTLYRDQRHSWQLVGRTGAGTREYASLALPRSLFELIDHRLRDLSPAAREVGLAAAVLGRETEIDLLRSVAPVSEDASTAAIHELIRRQVLEQPQPESVRFAHDKLREVTCAQASGDRVRQLHARAAAALEARCEGQADASRHWAALGHHFAAAQDSERAAHYLRSAADHARDKYANSDAIRLYREAIKQVNGILLRLESDPGQWGGALVELHESLADVLALTAQRDDARAGYEEALARIAQSWMAARARIHRKIGKTWETAHRHEEALRWYGLAQAVLPRDPLDSSAEERDEWIQVRIEQLWVSYWLNRLPEMEVLCSELAPVIRSHASPSQHSRFLTILALRNLRRDDYGVSEETLTFAREAVAAGKSGTPLADVEMALATSALVMLLGDRLDEAYEAWHRALSMARRAGDTAQEARSLAYLTVVERRRGRVEETKRHAEQCAKVAAAAGDRLYIALAHANLSWVLLREGGSGAAATAARQALELWNDLKIPFSFYWTALVPLLDIAASHGDTAEAVSCVKALLAPGQQTLPRAASGALTQALETFAVGDGHATLISIQNALKHLEESGYR